MRRASSETIFLIRVLLLSTLSGGAGILLFLKTGAISSRPSIPPPRLIGAKPEQATGKDAAVGNGYRLVEFMDYQCPPCRASQTAVKNILARYNGKVRIVIRNLPLKRHIYAFDAAVAAEASRKQNKFWEMREALLAGGFLDAAEVRRIERQVGFDESRLQKSDLDAARKRVQDDQQTADALQLDETPSWLLCTPDGKTWRLSNLSQVLDIVK